MSVDRGEYRSILRVIADGEDFQKLSTLARLAFLMLKLKFGPSGIEVRYPAELVGALEPQTGGTLDEVRAALNELVKAGWVRVDGNVIWIVDQLKFDPHMKATNPLHRKAIQRHINGLPSREIVKAWKAHYPEWMQPVTEEELKELRKPRAKKARRTKKGKASAEQMALDTLSDTHSDSPSHHNNKTKTKQEQLQNPYPAAPDGGGGAASAPPLALVKGGASRKERATWLTPYGDVWQEEMGGEIPFAEAARAFKKLEKAGHPKAEIVEVWRFYLRAHSGERADFASASGFAARYGQWCARWKGEGLTGDGAARVSARPKVGGGGAQALSPAQAAEAEKYARLMEEASNG